MANVQVHLLSQSQPIKRDNVVNTYTKDGLFCLYITKDGESYVEKYPLVNIFQIKEKY